MDPIDNTTMHNDSWRTRGPRHLVTLTDSKCKAAYDANLYSSILANLNVEQSITIQFSSGVAIAFYGFLRLFEPEEMTEDKMPTANITIVPTNVDPASGLEAPPVIGTVSGS
jgi:hypothetical protein